MNSRVLAAFVAASVLTSQCVPALADNQMGYRLLSQQEAAGLPHNQGALGLSISRASQINDRDMTFEIIRVTQVAPRSAGAAAGLKPGDQIIALDGRVFPSLIAFSDYVGSAQPGSQMTVDFMPANGGPQQAQRAVVLVGRAGQAQGERRDDPPARTGMSTGEKVAIGAGAVALFGCYEAGCFSHRAKPAAGMQPGQTPGGYQQDRSQNGVQQNGYQQGQTPGGYQQDRSQNGVQQNGYQQGQTPGGYQQDRSQNGVQQNGYQQGQTPGGYQQGQPLNGNQSR